MNSTGYGGEGAHRGFNDASVTLVSSALHGPLHVGGGTMAGFPLSGILTIR